MTVSAPPRPPGTPPATRRRLYTATALLLALVVLARLVYLPRLGNAYDLTAYREWTAAIQDHGLSNVFRETDTDYVGYHYVLWLIGQGFGRDAGAVTVRDKELRLWLKSPGLVGDVLSTGVVVGLAYALARRHRIGLPTAGARRLAAWLRLRDEEAWALAAGALWGLHPALVYTSAFWGQNDSLVTAFALAALWAGLARRPALAGALLITGATLKPQPLIIGPVLAWAVIDRCGWRGAARAAAAGLAVLVAGHLYFVLTGSLQEIALVYRNAVFTPQRLSFSAYNLWWPVAQARDPSSADTAFSIAGLDLAWGTLATVLTLAVLAITAAGLHRRRDDAGALLAAGYLIFGYFMVGSGVHERYDLPAFAFLLPALAAAPRWALPVLALSVTTTVNAVMGSPLDRLYPQGEPEWLSLGVVALNVVTLGWVSWLLIGPSEAAGSRQ